MVNYNFADWTAEGKNAMEPFLELQRMGGEISEKMMREHISFCSDNAGTFIKCMQTAPRMTRAEDMGAMQIKLIAEQGEKVVEYTQNMLKICKDALKNYCEWTEEKMSTALNVKQGFAGKSKKSEE